MIAPSMLNMLVGDSRSLQAVSSTGQTVTGLTWSSSNTAVVSLSTDDPPVLSALAPGRVTISAGGASADVVVMAGDQFPVGTTAWSTPVGVGEIIPAVPSSTGVADVFVVSPQAVSAVTSEGAVAWRATLPAQSWKTLADFQGGMIVLSGSKTITRLNGMTGALTALFNLPQNNGSQIHAMAIHLDGTIFATTSGPGPNNTSLTSLVGVDSATGGQKFSIPVDTSTSGSGGFLAAPMIAGDGYAYLPYATRTDCGGGSPSNRLFLLRVSSSGAASSILVTTWTSTCSDVVPVSVAPLITNGDTGALMSFVTNTDDHHGPGISSFYLATTNGLGVSLSSAPVLPGQEGPVEPRLQAEDGSFVGLARGDTMVAFDGSGGVRWAVRGQSPGMALADGEVITETGIKYDQSGRALSRGGGSSVYSWIWNAYQMPSLGAVARVTLPPLILAQSWWPWGGGNASKNNTGARDKYAPLESNANRRSTNSTCAGPSGICPQEALLSALKALKAIFDAPSCSACDEFLYSKVPGITREVMRGFLSRPPRWWDVTRSFAPYNEALCSSSFLGQLFCPRGALPVADYYRLEHPTASAVAQTPVDFGKGMQIFFNPRIGVCNVSAVANPAVGDKGVLNQALLLHESLHNWTGQYDPWLQDRLGIPRGGSENITFHLMRKIIPGGLQGAVSCQ